MAVATRGESWLRDPAAAADELGAQIAHDNAAFALVFASCAYDPDILVGELSRVFGSTPVVGCTSIGEIGRGGFGRHGMVGLTVSKSAVRVGIGCASSISKGAFRAGHAAVVEAASALGVKPADLAPGRHVGLCLIDWRSQSEELFIAGAGSTASRIPVIGGSASDDADLAPDRTGGHESRLFCRGQAVRDAGMIVLLETDLAFEVIVTEHMKPRDGRVVVTATDPASRLVTELDGIPALKRYKQVTGVGDAMNSEIAGTLPFGYYVDGRAYVRSVMAIEGDALRFAWGVDRGTVLVPMESGEMIPATETALAEVDRELGGEVEAVIAFSCYGRFLEAEREGLTDAVGEVLTRYPVMGFNTFGEQVNTLHVNHTLTGLAIGRRRRG